MKKLSLGTLGTRSTLHFRDKGKRCRRRYRDTNRKRAGKGRGILRSCRTKEKEQRAKWCKDRSISITSFRCNERIS
jgi:hypothetical protein